MINPKSNGGSSNDPTEMAQSRPAFTSATVAPLGLPKSGGALRGLGEKFQAGGPTGTGGLRVPLPISPCRNGAAPLLWLDYDSGQGHGPFGIGWNVGVPSISRRTDKGIPRYADAEESDIFIFSGQEDLVPVLATQDGGWAHERSQDGAYRIDAYRPRTEGLFARVERRTHNVTGDTHWRTISPDNATGVYGLSPGARIADPENRSRVSKWLLEATFDALGNVTFYEYKAEDLAGVSVTDVSEASRRVKVPANCYLKRVHYGNRAPLATRNPAYADIAALGWLFEVVFDYGEHSSNLPQEAAQWIVRQDPFSSFRTGFDIRTYRLCRRVLMFHEMPEQLGAPARLVKAMELDYDPKPTVTYLTGVRCVGYALDAAGNVATARTPTLRLDYTRVGALSTVVKVVGESSLAQLPGGIDGHNYQLVDLDGEGIAGILATAASPACGLYYKRNLGGAAFAVAERLPTQPSHQSMAADVQLLSLNSDGRLDVALLSGPTPGFFERTRSFDWAQFVTFQSIPKVDLAARGLHFIDLDGDGLADILVAEDEVFVWYSSLSRAGYGPPNRVTQPHDEDRGAAALTTDDYETIFLADMSGDGLSDLVRIRNGNICYWPNVGYGRFGARITMRNAPIFDAPDMFDPRRIRLGDVDGSGVTDIVYLSGKGAVVYLNEAGNGWATGSLVPLPVAVSTSTVRIADLLGTGTLCLVWSSVDPADARASVRYIDLLQGTKPHLLSNIVNGLGAQTTLSYAPSTQFYLEDRQAGRPWATRLPFVVQTVSRVQTTDSIALTRGILRYRYAHGFYDGTEREFRGFARVDSWDAESMSSDHGTGVAPGSIDEAGGQYDLPPTHTKSWYHTGAWNGERDDLRTALSAEYFKGDPLAGLLPPSEISSDLSPAALREAYRSLKGRLLRQEIYAEDATGLARSPYAVTEHRYEVRELQPIATQRHGVYFAFERETVAYHYERNTADPRIEHRLALDVDSLGHVVRSAHIAYARRSASEPEQAKVLATCESTTIAPPLATLYDFRHGVLTESRRYELFLASTSAAFPLAAVDAAMARATVLPFDGILASGAMRIIEHVHRQYWSDDLSTPLAPGSVGARALVYDQFAFAFPATLVSSIFGASMPAGDLTGAAGYASPDGDYWIRAGVTTYDAAHFYQATTFTDPFGNTSSVGYDAQRLFIVEEHTSANAAFDNVTVATIDYRVLAPAMMTDANGNRTGVAFDPLGMVVATAAMGRPGGAEGDTLADPTTRIEYDLLAWESSQRPACVHTYARQRHGESNPGWFETYSYSDGSGNEVLNKVQAEPDVDRHPRWAGTGRTVFDNKGNPIKKYEPYFATDPGYDDEAALVQTGYCKILRYDPLSRLVRTDHPDGTFATTAWDAWSEVLSDADDTVLDSAWYAAASARPASDPLKRAATLAANNANTPAIRSFDPLGRTFRSIADNGAGKYETRTKLDIQGNIVATTDAIGNLALQQVFDAQGNALKRAGLDAGTSRAVGDCLGRLYRSWDARGYAQLRVYDPLRRLTQLWVTPPNGTKFLAELIVYGEGLVAPNFRGRLYQHFDGAGALTNAGYDFEGRNTRTTRQLAAIYQSTPDWDSLANLTDPAAVLPAAAAAGLLETDVFETLTAYDAMSRLVSVTTPDKTVVVPSYNAASLLGSVAAFMQGGAIAKPIVTNVDYDARGQRLAVSYGNGTLTQFTYDDRTQMVLRVDTTRRSDGTALQDLNYTYDPALNIVQISDLAQQTLFFAGSVTTGTQLFEYDAIYRLVTATGREQPGQVGYAIGPNGYPDAPISNIPHRNDLEALLAYTESYTYDAVGNRLTTVHRAAGAGWTRTQTYTTGTNRLDRVSMPGDPANGPYSGIYRHDASGNIVQTPNLAAMAWSHDARLISADLGGGGMAYFTYDSAGQRVRKIVQRNTGQIHERVYIGGFERYRDRKGASIANSTITLERETVHIMDGDRRFAIVETKTLDTSLQALVPTPLFRFQLVNHLGSTCLEIDDAGAPISYEEYYAFGGSSYRAGDADKRYRFLSKERDDCTGLYYFGARYYIPWVGRWASVDPLILAQQRDDRSSRQDSTGWSAGSREKEAVSLARGGQATSGSASEYNGYLYALNNPQLYVDPDGRAPVQIGQIYVLKGAIEGVSVVYTGSTVQELRARLGKHAWRELAASESTTIESYPVKAELNIAASGRQSIRSARTEALRAAEQVVIKRRRTDEQWIELNKHDAAAEHHIDKWADRHEVTLGARTSYKTGIVSSAFALLQAEQLFTIWREAKLSQFVMAPYQLGDDHGVFTLDELDRGIFRSNKYFKTYQTGALAGKSVEVSKGEFKSDLGAAQELWGTTDWKGDWVPGLLRPELPVIDQSRPPPRGL
jgi:RHS repeat-associated protein